MTFDASLLKIFSRELDSNDSVINPIRSRFFPGSFSVSSQKEQVEQVALGLGTLCLRTHGWQNGILRAIRTFNRDKITRQDLTEHPIPGTDCTNVRYRTNHRPLLLTTIRVTLERLGSSLYNNLLGA